MEANLLDNYKPHMKLVRTVLTAAAGVAYGMFFAPKSGKKFREELANSKNPGKILFDHLKEMAKDSGTTAKKWAQESQELQEVLASGRKQFDHLVEGAEDLGKEGIAQLKKHFQELADNAEKAMKDLDKKAGKFKNEVEKTVKKEVKTIAKKLKK